MSRSRWLSLAGGVSVAYVFVHILPELAKGQDVMVRADLPPDFLEHRVLNVVKEELPEGQESLCWAFAPGAALYAALLLVLQGNASYIRWSSS